MDFQEFVDSVSLPSAVMSVEQRDDGSCGDIHIVCANREYKDLMGPDYRDGLLYYELLPRNMNFEHFCFSAAILGKRGHTYVETPNRGVWTDEVVVPLRRGEDGVGYCMFVIEQTSGLKTERRAAVSKNTAEAAIRASITLMGAEDFRAGVRTVLNDTLVMSGAHNSRVFLLDRKNRSLNVFCESVGPEGHDRHKDAVTYDIVEMWEKIIGSRNALLIANERDLNELEKTVPAWVANMREYDVHTLALLPLRSGREIFGYVDFVNFDAAMVEQVRELAELIVIYLGSEISNHLLLQKLEEMSTTDGLTGLKNRNAMLRRMDMMGGEAFGVINLDLNGLKLVNDRDGHAAGDRLLISAAEALRKIFYFNDIYRTGGDEFIVLAPGITRESFERKLERFRLAVEKNGELSFAIGAAWSDGSMDVTTAFRCADERMYEDKRRYYDRHPELRRR